jgi:PIN domain nuclease of toxin-antitoxin system
VIEEADEIAISSISVWEIGIKVKKKRLSIPLAVDALIRLMKGSFALEVIPVEDRHWLASLALDWDHQDPADRVIVATATVDELPLVTEDRLIRSYYQRTIW